METSNLQTFPSIAFNIKEHLDFYLMEDLLKSSVIALI